MSRRFLINDSRVTKFVAESVGSADFTSHTSIGVERDGEVIAGVIYENWNGKNVFMHVAARCGSRWLTKGFAKLVFGYAFSALGVSRITGVVPESNSHALRFDSGMGFEHEATLKGAAPDGGDLLVLRMFKESCRWIK